MGTPEAALASSETVVSKAWDSEGEERAMMALTGKVSLAERVLWEPEE